MRTYFFGMTLLIALVGVLATAPAMAQHLPPAPQANNTTDARASQRGESGGALEPYLITWLLPAFGVIGLIACTIVDRRLRA